MLRVNSDFIGQRFHVQERESVLVYDLPDGVGHLEILIDLIILCGNLMRKTGKQNRQIFFTAEIKEFSQCLLRFRVQRLFRPVIFYIAGF